jgi:hypothetical protein
MTQEYPIIVNITDTYLFGLSNEAQDWCDANGINYKIRCKTSEINTGVAAWLSFSFKEEDAAMAAMFKLAWSDFLFDENSLLL